MSAPARLRFLLCLLTDPQCAPCACRLPPSCPVSAHGSARPILKLTALALPPRSSDAGRTRPSSRGGSWRTWTSSGDDFLISRQHGHETRCYVPREPRSALVCAAATAAYTRTAAPAVGTMTGCGSLGFRRMLRGQWCMYSRVHCRFRSREASRVVVRSMVFDAECARERQS